MTAPLEPDRDQIEIFVNAIFRHAKQGFVSLRAFYEGADEVFRISPVRVLDNNLKFLIDAAEDDARRAAQFPRGVVFCPPLCTFRAEKGAAEADLLEGLTLSVECDENAQAARKRLEALLGPVTLAVRSGGVWQSNGAAYDKEHLHWRLTKPAIGKEQHAKLKRAREIACSLVGADPTTAPICHPLRWPGSWHRKAEPRPCEIILDASNFDSEIDLDEALAKLEPLAPPPPPPMDFNNARPQQGGDWDVLVANILRGEGLHKSITRLAMKLLKSGMNDPAAVNHLRALMVQSQAPRDERWQKRFDSIPRAVSSAAKKLAKAEQPTPEQPEEQPAPAEPEPSPQPIPDPTPIAAVRALFQKWLGKDYDTDVLDATLATAAAERLTGDPLWLLVIGGPGVAKTETVQSLAGAGATVTSTIASEGALMSATSVKSKAKGATGGLLVKLGNRGVLVLKDVTTLLSADRNVRNAVLAALREIHDGKWERNVGTDGGRTLRWVGRIVVVGAVTTAWDAAHSVTDAMGNRFVVVRADSNKGRGKSARKAIDNTGREMIMRKELATAVGAIIGNASTDEYKLKQKEIDKLVKAADIVTLARTAVERDYQGNIIDAHAPEMPTRFAKQLAQMVRGGVAIGMSATDSMRLALRCARDSIPPLRRDILLDLAENPRSEPKDVRKRIEKPRMTVRRELEALHILGLLQCDEEEERGADGKKKTKFLYGFADDEHERTLLEMVGKKVPRKVSSERVKERME